MAEQIDVEVWETKADDPGISLKAGAHYKVLAKTYDKPAPEEPDEVVTDDVDIFVFAEPKEAKESGWTLLKKLFDFELPKFFWGS